MKNDDRDWKRFKETAADRQREIEEGVMVLFNKWMRRLCITCTIAILGMGYSAGKWIAFHSDRVVHALSVLFSDGSK